MFLLQAPILGLFPALLLAGGYVTWWVLSALAAIADAQQRLAATEEERAE